MKIKIENRQSKFKAGIDKIKQRHPKIQSIKSETQLPDKPDKLLTSTKSAFKSSPPLDKHSQSD